MAACARVCERVIGNLYIARYLHIHCTYHSLWCCRYGVCMPIHIYFSCFESVKLNNPSSSSVSSQLSLVLIFVSQMPVRIHTIHSNFCKITMVAAIPRQRKINRFVRRFVTVFWIKNIYILQFSLAKLRDSDVSFRLDETKCRRMLLTIRNSLTKFVLRIYWTHANRTTAAEWFSFFSGDYMRPTSARNQSTHTVGISSTQYSILHKKSLQIEKH